MYIKNIEEYVDHVPYNTEIAKITNKLRSESTKKEYRRRMKEQRMQSELVIIFRIIKTEKQYIK